MKTAFWINHDGRLYGDRLRKGIAKLLALILCLSLFCAFLPMTALAEEGEESPVPEAEDIAQSETAAPEGSATIVENVVETPAAAGAPATETNNLEALLGNNEETDDLSYSNDFPAVVETQVYDNAGVVHKTVVPPYTPGTGSGSGTGSGTGTQTPGTGTQTPGTSVISELYEPKTGAEPVSTDIVIKGTNETVVPPEEVQEQLEGIEFGALQKNDNNTPQDTTDDTYVRTRETTTDNAINKAVQEALARATTDSKYITIVVSEGQYDGDITVDATGKNLADGFKLYVLAEDSYKAPEEGGIIDKTTVGAQSEGGANVTGNITVNAAKNFELIMAGLYLSVNSLVEAKNKASVTIYGTQEADTVTYTQSGEGDAAIHTGDGDDTVTLAFAGSEKTSVTVDSGDGDDTVSVSGEKAGGQKSELSVNLGAGADSVSVDMNTANALSNTKILGGEGYDVLTLSGEIDTDGTNTVDEEAVMLGQQVVDYNFVIHAASKAGKPITIDADSIHALADGITNKPQQTITDSNIIDDIIYVSNSFTNYVIEDGSILGTMKTGTLTMRAEEGKRLYFAKLVLSGDQLEIGSIDVTGLDLEINGKEIRVDGALTADNIIIRASDDDKNALSQPGSLQLGDVNTGLDFDFLNFDLETGAKIQITKDARLTALKNIALSASSSQTQPIFHLNTGLQESTFPIIVKVGLAEIGIDGSLEAGGKVEADSNAKIIVKSNNELYKRIRVPLSVVVAAADARTGLTTTGTITSGSLTRLSSKAEVTTSSVATIGIVPLSLALSVVSLDAVTTVDGVINAGGNIDILAEGTSSVTTISQEDPPAELLKADISTGEGGTTTTPPAPSEGTISFGGFFAVAVVLQNCKALVTEGAQLTSGGDINILSKSVEKARTVAQASMNNANGQSQAMDLNSITGIMTGILKLLTSERDTLTAVGKAKLGGLVDNGIKQISGGKLTITVKPTEHGTVTTPVKTNTGDTVTVRAVPDSGYTIDTASISYTDPKTNWVKNLTVVPETGEGRPDTTDFTFVMPDNSVTLTVVFRQLKQNEQPLTLGTGAIDSNAGIAGAVETATGSATEPFSPPEYPTGIGPGVYKITPETLSSAGTGSISLDTGYAKKDQKVLVRVNPADGYELEKLTLKKRNTVNGLVISSEEELAADTNGRYIFTMGEGDVDVMATFRKSAGGASGPHESFMGSTGTAHKN